MTTHTHTHRVSDAMAHTVGGVDRYVIASGGKAIIEDRSNGQPTYLTYKTKQKAVVGLNRTLPNIPSAAIHDKEPNEKERWR